MAPAVIEFKLLCSEDNLKRYTKKHHVDPIKRPASGI